MLAWLVGRVLNDRYEFSQWLWWIPTLLTLLCMAVNLVFIAGMFGAGRFRRRVAVLWIIGAAVVFMYFAIVDQRMLRQQAHLSESTPALKVAHWNVQPPALADVEPSIAAVQRLNADVIVLTDPGGLLQNEQSQSFIEEGFQIASAFPFAMISRVPVISMRTVVHVDQLHVVIAQLGTDEVLGRPLTLYLVDLPSRPGAARMEIARRLRGMIDKLSLPVPDMVVGDFNIPRGSASLDTLFPNMRHAFKEAGHGYGATFPRTFPLWHIDHMLLSPSLHALDYDIIDPGRSRHRMQVARISTQP